MKQHTESHESRTGHPARQAAGNSHASKSRTGGRKRVAPERRRAMIAEAAYYLAEKRGFAPGDDLHDWLEAESQIETLLS